MECTVKSWLFGTITSELLEIIMTSSLIALLIWLGLEQKLIGNKETHALLLDAEFQMFVQGDLSISDYYRKLKNMADALGDLGEMIHDRTLVLNVLWGLNDKYSYMAALLKHQRSFPSFIDVRANLLHEELTMEPKMTSSMMLVAIMPFASCAPVGSVTSATQDDSSPASIGATGSSSSNGNSRNRHRQCRNNFRGASGQSDANGSNTNAPGWPPMYNPWTDIFMVWPGLVDNRRNPSG
ncbi:uncharacterized protein LOC133886484 [Phragmites australis]|uniref:uncharacterized protein LOC133886484 n=1 Tax=Phragmites australis TaxID=29695 RepID=UPI002D79C427|nr:uncharacterized protein LOC133886484 [Phragmites australis]